MRTQNYKEARAILTEFRDLCSNVYGAQELTAKINEELDAIPIEKPSLGERKMILWSTRKVIVFLGLKKMLPLEIR